MEFGLFTEFQSPPGMTDAQAFDESMAQICAAEEFGCDAVWLAEIHFQQGRSVLSSPLIVASAIAGRTKRVKIGIAVQVLPPSHPPHLAEDVATLDHLCKCEAGHPGRGSVGLIVPVYVADSACQAREEPEASTMFFFRSIAEALARGGTNREEAARLGRLSYDEILDELAVYGTPEAVTDRLLELRETLGFSTLSVWMNVGGRIPHEHTMTSMRLFAERVAPRLS